MTAAFALCSRRSPKISRHYVSRTRRGRGELGPTIASGTELHIRMNDRMNVRGKSDNRREAALQRKA